MPHAIEKIMGSRVILGEPKPGAEPPKPGSPEYAAYMERIQGSNIRRRKKKGGTSVSS